MNISTDMSIYSSAKSAFLSLKVGLRLQRGWPSILTTSRPRPSWFSMLRNGRLMKNRPHLLSLLSLVLTTLSQFDGIGSYIPWYYGYKCALYPCFSLFIMCSSRSNILNKNVCVVRSGLDWNTAGLSVKRPLQWCYRTRLRTPYIRHPFPPRTFNIMYGAASTRFGCFPKWKSLKISRWN